MPHVFFQVFYLCTTKLSSLTKLRSRLLAIRDCYSKLHCEGKPPVSHVAAPLTPVTHEHLAAPSVWSHSMGCKKWPSVRFLSALVEKILWSQIRFYSEWVDCRTQDKVMSSTCVSEPKYHRPQKSWSLQFLASHYPYRQLKLLPLFCKGGTVDLMVWCDKLMALVKAHSVFECDTNAHLLTCNHFWKITLCMLWSIRSCWVESGLHKTHSPQWCCCQIWLSVCVQVCLCMHLCRHEYMCVYGEYACVHECMIYWSEYTFPLYILYGAILSENPRFPRFGLS